MFKSDTYKDIISSYMYKLILGFFALIIAFSGSAEETLAYQSQSNDDDELYSYVSTSQKFIENQNLVTLNLMGATIPEALELISKTLNVGFSYNPEIIPDKSVSFDVSNMPAFALIETVLEGTDLEFTLTSGRNVIVINKKNKEASLDDFLQETITGVVVDARSGETLPGVNIVIEGTTIGATTNMDGEYELQVPTLEETLVFSYIGYQRLVVEIDGRNEINVELSREAIGLDELVVTGAAGETRTREMGQTVARINTDNLPDVSVNTDELLQGRIAGVDVTNTSGSIGAGSQIRLRGNVSLSMSNQPLIIIDGVRFSANEYPRGNSEGDSFFRGANVSQNPLNDINPNDIERIEIIRGPSASTLYGTEAAAGVIQVFTKKGQSGEPRWSAQIDQSLSFMRPFGPSNDKYIGMDPWLSTGHGQNYNLSVSGGQDSFDYLVSGSYREGSGVLPNDQEDRYTIRGNIGFTAFENFRLQWQTHYSSHTIENTSTGNNAHGLQFNVYRAPNNPIGSSEKSELDKILNQDITTRNDRFNTAVTARYFPLEGLDMRFQVGYDRLDQRFNHIRPFGFALQTQGAITDKRWVSEGITLDFATRYRYDITDDFNTRLSFGGQLNTQKQHEIDAFGQGYPGPGEYTITAAAERVVVANEFEVITGGFFAENTFDYLDRYFFTVGLRVDGNSAFGDDFGLQPYPKASVSYVLSDESFWSDALGSFRLRAAYGQAGRAPGAFDAVRTWQAEGYGGISAFRPQNVGNPELGPEVTTELEVGFESSTLNDRLNIEFSYYNQETNDALFAVSQSPSLGFTGSQLRNVGVLSNQGIELTIMGTLIQRGDLFLDLGTTIYTNKSEVKDTGGENIYTIVEGQPGPVVRGTKVTNPDDFSEAQFEFDHFFGPNQPTHIIGVNLTLGLPKGILFSARGEYQGGHYINSAASSFMVNRGAGSPSCQVAYDQVPYATGDPNNHPNIGNVNALMRTRCYRQNIQSNSWIFPSDFFRLRSVSVQIPIGQYTSQLRSASFTITGRNLLTWKNNDFWEFDPEMTYRSVGDLTRFIGEHIPAPASVTGTLRIDF